MVYLVVKMTAKEGKKEELFAACRKVALLVEAEPGCVFYNFVSRIEFPLPAQTPIDSNQLTLLECWQSREALQAHGKQPHMRDFGKKVADLRESMSIEVFEKI